ncbi:hypothetical protein BgAZ_303510 [Babesia gibsoni]|uniref:CPW-WPC domain-containing protein n=1 Tax=Babesia gibsoni TaxID=33632 RepID=A0AAD8PD26_BABGI|nr:hypothetical protein BgAZ_303510 [Babesia gibsoni]
MWKWFWWISVAIVAVSSAQKSVLFDILLKEAKLRYESSGTPLTPEELEKRVTSSIQRASELLNLDAPIVHDDCEIDFAAFCPEGWVSSGDGIHCQVLPWSTGSTGICGEKLDMTNKSPLDKLQLMKMCNIRWPCLKNDGKVPISDEICPKYWLRKDNECLADPTYMGPCGDRIRLFEKSQKEREELTRRCHLSFPLHPELLDPDIDWTANCPLGWSYQESGVCTQIMDQSNGRCGRTLLFHDQDDKRRKTQHCGLVWPPIGESVKSQCPLGWELDGNTSLCIAPSSYMGPCQLRVDFSNYSIEDMEIWAHVCRVSFLDGGEIQTPKAVADVSYRSGALDKNLSVVRFGKSVKDVRVMERQLDELKKLRKKRTEGLFLRTLDKSIATLKSQLKNAQTGHLHSFLQLASISGTADKISCPYGWRQFDTVCVADETYGKIVPSCKTIRPASDVFEERCRVSKRKERTNEDFVRAYCPIGWKTRQVYFHSLVRHLCVAPIDFKESQKKLCGGSTLDFTARSPGFKRRWAYACDQYFPNFMDTKAPKCVENFYWKCPAEWSIVGDECVAPKYYDGPCPGSVKLTDIAGEVAKSDFSKRCYAAWPCVGRCEKDYNQDCPEFWTRKGDRCVLEDTAQASHCGRDVAIHGSWSNFHKEEVEFLCDVHWPCKRDQQQI